MITLVLTLLAVWLYCQSLRIALIPVMCSVIAVMWQLGVLVVLGYGIDPLGLLVPFLIFAIGVSHGVQKISAVKEAAFFGIGSMEAARRTFRQLLAPAVIALLADLVGFITILLIPGAGDSGNGDHREHRCRHRHPDEISCCCRCSSRSSASMRVIGRGSIIGRRCCRSCGSDWRSSRTAFRR